MIGKALFSRLTSDEDVSAIVETRVYPQLSPKQRDYPVIVYDIQDTSTESAQDAPSDLTSFRILLVCIARTLADLEQLAAAVRNCVDNKSGLWGTTTIAGSFVESTEDSTFIISDAVETRYVVRELSCLIWAPTSGA